MAARRSVLAVIEPEMHPHAVVARAIWLARQTGCDLELLLCDKDIGPLGASFVVSNDARDIGEKIREAQVEMIEELAAPARDDIAVTTSVLEERPIADGVIARALDLEPAFVVKGTEYHSVAERSIFVDTDWQLIRGCPFPLWLVKEGDLTEKPDVVAAVDPTHSHDKPAALDQVIVDYAKQVAARSGGAVHLVHTYQRLAGIGAAATKTFKPIKLPIDELDERIRADHREKLDTLAAGNQIDAGHVHQLPGPTREVVPMFTRTHKIGVVVMGALARWGIKRMVIGSTAERVLDHLPCDILIVRSEAGD